MSSQNTSYQANAARPRPSFGGNKVAAAVSKKANSNNDQKKIETTHYMKSSGENSDFVKGSYITENEFGLCLYTTVDLPAGRYYINKKRDKSAE